MGAQTYYNHLTGEKRSVERKKFVGSIKGKHDINLEQEQNPDIKPLYVKAYENLQDAKEAEGSMLFLDEPNMNKILMQRGNTIEEIEKFYRDIITACKKFGVELTTKFKVIAKELKL